MVQSEFSKDNLLKKRLEVKDFKMKKIRKFQRQKINKREMKVDQEDKRDESESYYLQYNYVLT